MILLVEDDEDVRDMMALTLEMRGFQVTQAANGEAALQLLDQQRPCLMILDLVMPGLGGREVLARMKTQGHALPVIVVSALDAAPPDGVVTILRKPFDTPTLLELATRYCSCRAGASIA